MTSETLEIVNTYRNAGHIVSDKECEDVFALCERKMETCRIEDRDSYMPLLFADEFKNFLFRRFVNACTMEFMRPLPVEGKES